MFDMYVWKFEIFVFGNLIFDIYIWIYENICLEIWSDLDIFEISIPMMSDMPGGIGLDLNWIEIKIWIWMSSRKLRRCGLQAYKLCDKQLTPSQPKIGPTI